MQWLHWAGFAIPEIRYIPDWNPILPVGDPDSPPSCWGPDFESVKDRHCKCRTRQNKTLYYSCCLEHRYKNKIRCKCHFIRRVSVTVKYWVLQAYRFSYLQTYIHVSLLWPRLHHLFKFNHWFYVDSLSVLSAECWSRLSNYQLHIRSVDKSVKLQKNMLGQY